MGSSPSWAWWGVEGSSDIPDLGRGGALTPVLTQSDWVKQVRCCCVDLVTCQVIWIHQRCDKVTVSFEHQGGAPCRRPSGSTPAAGYELSEPSQGTEKTGLNAGHERACGTRFYFRGSRRPSWTKPQFLCLAPPMSTGGRT